MNELKINTTELNLNELISYKESFIKYLDVDEETLKTYKNGIKSFFNYLKDNSIIYPTRLDVISYRDMLRNNYTSSTVNTYMASLRALFKYLYLNHNCEDLTKDIKGARYSNIPKKQVLSKEKVQEIYKNLTDVREKLLFSLLITTGLRGVEVANSKIEDIKKHNGETVLWVKCKKHSAKDEYVKLSDLVLEDLKEYIGNRTSGYIFISTSKYNYGDGISTTAIRRIIKKIFKRFGLDDNTYSLHSTRRTSATLMYESGQTIYDIKQVLHHTGIQTTARYINSVTRNNNTSEYMVSNILGENCYE